MDGEVTEYICYEAISSIKTKSSFKSSFPIWIFVLIGLLLLVILLIVIVIIIGKRSKRRDLMERVDKISFVTSKSEERKTTDDINLLLDDKNEAYGNKCYITSQ